MEDLFEIHHRLIGIEKQQKIESSRVAVIGIGGLGCAVAQNLVRLGVTHITLIDSDKVTVSNLPRQVLFTKHDIGRHKIVAAKDALMSFSSEVRIETKIDNLTLNNGVQLLNGHHAVIDCTDNYVSRYAISKTSKALNIPMIYGGVDQFEGQVGVFNYKGSKSFHEVFPDLDSLMENETCNASGVLPFVVQIVGAMQVAEFYKIQLEAPNTLNNQLLCIHTISGRQRILNL